MPPSAPMQSALEAAAAVRGTTSPNPWVGAAIVRDGEIVAVGATSPPGGPHAEAAALTSAGPAARGATLYTTLEPCFPFEGKRTPPCSQAIVDAGIARVVVALEDADPRVRGSGNALLREAGVMVEIGDGAAEARALLRPYLKHRATGLPYVILKFAASLDGRVATRSGDSRWITGEAAREHVHQQRARVDAILTGSGTVLADDPALTARPEGTAAGRQPVRVVVDSRGSLPLTAQLLSEPGHTIVATTRRADRGWKQEIVALGASIIECEEHDRGLNLRQLLQALGQRSILSVWTEAGGTLLGSLLDDDLADEVFAYIAPRIIGGDGLPAINVPGAATIADSRVLRDVTMEQLGNDMLVRGYTGPFEP